MSHSNFYLPHLIGFIYYGKVISFLLRNKIYLQKYNLTVFLRHLSNSYLEFYLKQKYATHKITNSIPHFPNPLIPKQSTNLQKYLDTSVSTSPHVRVETSARTCQDLVTYVSRYLRQEISSKMPFSGVRIVSQLFPPHRILRAYFIILSFGSLNSLQGSPNLPD